MIRGIGWRIPHELGTMIGAAGAAGAALGLAIAFLAWRAHARDRAT